METADGAVRLVLNLAPVQQAHGPKTYQEHIAFAVDDLVAAARAARARGLGGVMTTFLSRAEPDAAPELGLPPDHALVATIFLGVPRQQVTKLRREPVETFATIDRFDGDVLTA